MKINHKELPEDCGKTLHFTTGHQNYMGIRALHICLDDDHDVHVVAACLGLGIYICTLYTYVCIIGGGPIIQTI